MKKTIKLSKPVEQVNKWGVKVEILKTSNGYMLRTTTEYTEQHIYRNVDTKQPFYFEEKWVAKAVANSLCSSLSL